jgi:hypothetical protein
MLLFADYVSQPYCLCDQISDGSNLKEEGFILSIVSEVASIMVEGVWVNRAALLMAARKQNEDRKRPGQEMPFKDTPQ